MSDFSVVKYHPCEVCHQNGIPEFEHKLGKPAPPKEFECTHCKSRYRESRRWRVMTDIMTGGGAETHFYGIITLGFGYIVAGVLKSLWVALRMLITLNRRYILIERGSKY